MKVYNTLSGKKEEFIPINGNKVNMYACGITVYDECHMGHAKQAIIYDMITRYLRYRGYDVTYVRNYTDVDDKIINRANQLGIDALEYSKDRIKEVERVLGLLKVIDADINPKASENIDGIIEFTEKLIEKGHAYPTERGDVYFSVKSFKEYGKLSNRNIDELLNGVRKDVEDGKRDPLDFALWKSAKEGEIAWDSPWGKGRPGWHIECSVMSMKNLGECIDIHGGGKDLVFPHHENEIAQSEALTGKQFAKYWIHSGLITINGQKMSKSLGNSKTIRETLDVFNPEVIKYTIFSKHYSTNTDLGDKEYALSEKQMFYFYNTLNDIDNFVAKNPKSDESIVIDNDISMNIESDFIASMDDDFNTAEVLAQLFNTCKFVNNLIKNNKYPAGVRAKVLADIKEKLVKLYNILGLLQEEPIKFLNELRTKHLKDKEITEAEIEGKIQERMEAKQNKDYTKADEIRNELDKFGIVLFDTKESTTWGIKDLYSLN